MARDCVRNTMCIIYFLLLCLAYRCVVYVMVLDVWCPCVLSFPFLFSGNLETCPKRRTVCPTRTSNSSSQETVRQAGTSFPRVANGKEELSFLQSAAAAATAAAAAAAAPAAAFFCSRRCACLVSHRSRFQDHGHGRRCWAIFVSS